MCRAMEVGRKAQVQVEILQGAGNFGAVAGVAGVGAAVLAHVLRLRID